MSSPHRPATIVRHALAVVAAVTFAVFASGSGYQGSEGRRPPASEVAVEIYVAAEWYRARPEPEEQWEGVLEKHDPLIGPAGRPMMGYTLRTSDRQLPIYAAGVQDRLAPLVRRPVLVVGKLVSLSTPGLGQELWIATIRPLAEESSGRK